MSELKNKDPELIEDTIRTVSGLLSQYGWYVLSVIFGLVFVYQKYLSTLLHQMRERSEDSEVMASRVEAMERARRKQQEVYDKTVEELKAKETEKVVEKRQKLNELKESINNCNKSDNSLRKRTTNSVPFRDNGFNPLMGTSSGSSYRPSRPCGPSGGG